MCLPSGSFQICFSGGFGEGVTPVPIPNTAVKPLCADGTARARVWESRSLPESYFLKPAGPPGLGVDRRRPPG